MILFQAAVSCPDWAIVKNNDHEKVYFVRETKGADFNKKEGRASEYAKVLCGKKHFKALGVDFKVVTLASEV